VPRATGVCSQESRGSLDVPTAGLRWAAPLAGLWIAGGMGGCAGRAVVRPTMARTTYGDQVAARVEQLELGYDGTPEGVVIRIRNRGLRTVHVDPDALVARPSTRTNGTAGTPLGPVGSGAAGGLFSGGGGAAGLVVALPVAQATIVVLAVGAAGAVVGWAVYEAVDAAREAAARELSPGESSRFWLAVPHLRLVRGGIDLQRALRVEGAPVHIDPLPLSLARSTAWGSPGPLTSTFVVHMGGGPVWRRQAPGGALGGLEFLVGPQVGPLALTAVLPLGAGAIGADTRLALVRTDSFSLVASIGYGYYWLVGGLGIGAGHGPRGGLEISGGAHRRPGPLGWPAAPTWIGGYVELGPILLREGDVAMQGQAGLSVGL
jgi:hypothetical protein